MPIEFNYAVDDFNERKIIESHRPYEVARFTLRHLYNISGRFEKWLTEDSEVEVFSWDKKKTSQTQHIQTQKPQQTAAEIQEMIFKILKPKPKV
jgi:hypothetical protein